MTKAPLPVCVCVCVYVCVCVFVFVFVCVYVCTCTPMYAYAYITVPQREEQKEPDAAEDQRLEANHPPPTPPPQRTPFGRTPVPPIVFAQVHAHVLRRPTPIPWRRRAIQARTVRV